MPEVPDHVMKSVTLNWPGVACRFRLIPAGRHSRMSDSSYQDEAFNDQRLDGCILWTSRAAVDPAA
jgi:hypothetical protein